MPSSSTPIQERTPRKEFYGLGGFGFGRCRYGNVRELENAIRRAAVFARDGVILADHLPPDILDPHIRPPGAGGSPTASLERALSALSGPAEEGNVYYELQAHVDRATMTIALASSGGNQVKAAAWLGISRTTLRRRIEELDVGGSDGGES